MFIYNWFKKAMKSVGSRSKDPKCADIKKTYQYRAVNQFVDKARGYSLNSDQMQALVKEIVRYSKDHNLLHRGTAVLNMSDIFSICSKRLEMSVEAIDTAVELIKLSAHVIEDDLHVAEQLGGYPKLVSLYNSDQLPIELLALSKKCIAALRRISSIDRQLLPSDVDLLKIRIKLLMDRDVKKKVKKILGNDLLEAGVPK